MSFFEDGENMSAKIVLAPARRANVQKPVIK